MNKGKLKVYYLTSSDSKSSNCCILSAKAVSNPAMYCVCSSSADTLQVTQVMLVYVEEYGIESGLSSSSGPNSSMNGAENRHS